MPGSVLCIAAAAQRLHLAAAVLEAYQRSSKKAANSRRGVDESLSGNRKCEDEKPTARLVQQERLH